MRKVYVLVSNTDPMDVRCFGNRKALYNYLVYRKNQSKYSKQSIFSKRELAEGLSKHGDILSSVSWTVVLTNLKTVWDNPDIEGGVTNVEVQKER